MAKNKISEWSATAANNTDIGGIDIAEGCAPSGINNAIRELMAQVKDQQTGTDADNFTVGGNLSVTGTSSFTGLVSLASLATTGSTTLGDAAGDVLTITGTAITTPNGLNFDSNTLVVDATNNRVGIAKASPTTALDVTGTVTATAFAGALTGAVTGNVTGNLTGNVTGNITGASTGAHNGTVGATTPSTGAFTTISSSGQITGNLTGNVTGNVAGTLTGTIASSTVATTQSSGDSSTKVATTAFVIAALALAYPVGSIFTSTSSTNPATSLGFGTWVAFGAGRVLIGNGGGFTAGATGGSADAVVVSHTHTATVTDAGHTHNYSDSSFISAAGPIENGGEWRVVETSTATSSATTGITVANSTTGSSGTNANLQPYVVVYMWNRTA